MSEEALKMYAQLTQEISLCQDEDLKKLGKGILELTNNYDKSLKKNEQLQQRIDKAIDMLDLIIPELWNISNAMTYKIKEVKRILGEKE